VQSGPGLVDEDGAVTRDELAAWWRWFAEHECPGYSPLYERICAAVAEADAVLDRLLVLPSHAQQPNMLLAAAHDMVLRGAAPSLASCYDDNLLEQVGDRFVEIVTAAWSELVPILEQRRTQTNEIGRVAVLAPALATVAGDLPVTVVDVGTSAGLTLQLDRCLIDYGPAGVIGDPESPVRVTCEVLHGHPPLRSTPVVRRIGIDRHPLDPTDPDDARWLLACTWPDTGRLERTRAALGLAAEHPAELRTGDAVQDVPALLDDVDGAVVITTTWVAAYLSPEERAAFAEMLAAASRGRPVAWMSAEGPGVVPGLPQRDAPPVEGPTASALGTITYLDGDAHDARLLAHVHPHGHWLWWY
jgi:hypothetical protein